MSHEGLEANNQKQKAVNSAVKSLTYSDSETVYQERMYFAQIEQELIKLGFDVNDMDRVINLSAKGNVDDHIVFNRAVRNLRETDICSTYEVCLYLMEKAYDLPKEAIKCFNEENMHYIRKEMNKKHRISGKASNMKTVMPMFLELD
jgi:hypothetical protein